MDHFKYILTLVFTKYQICNIPRGSQAIVILKIFRLRSLLLSRRRLRLYVILLSPSFTREPEVCQEVRNLLAVHIFTEFPSNYTYGFFRPLTENLRINFYNLRLKFKTFLAFSYQIILI